MSIDIWKNFPLEINQKGAEWKGNWGHTWQNNWRQNDFETPEKWRKSQAKCGPNMNKSIEKTMRNNSQYMLKKCRE